MFFFFFQRINDFVSEMFQYLNIEYQREVTIKDKKIDFILKGYNNLDTIVEVKETKSNYSELIINATNQLRIYRQMYSKEKVNKYSILFLFSNVDKHQKDYFLKDNIVILDIANILYLIKNNEELTSNLKNILPYSIVGIIPEKIELDKYINYKDTQKEETNNCIEDEYIRKIKSIKKGKEGSKEFEIIGEEIIKLLFGDYIYNWKSQVNCNANLQRIDLIGKVKEQEGFWNTLHQIYKSRYIVFEFKNYNNQIKQDEIYSTNKYLYKDALRTVAIIISRDKMDANAKKTCEGILRNEKNLILNLDENDLITMLKSKKENCNKDICSEYMENLFDNFLICLAK